MCLLLRICGKCVFGYKNPLFLVLVFLSVLPTVLNSTLRDWSVGVYKMSWIPAAVGTSNITHQITIRICTVGVLCLKGLQALQARDCNILEGMISGVKPQIWWNFLLPGQVKIDKSMMDNENYDQKNLFHSDSFIPLGAAAVVLHTFNIPQCLPKYNNDFCSVWKMRKD